jgi:hypothetical protein
MHEVAQGGRHANHHRLPSFFRKHFALNVPNVADHSLRLKCRAGRRERDLMGRLHKADRDKGSSEEATANGNFRPALAAHFRWLRELGMPGNAEDEPSRTADTLDLTTEKTPSKLLSGN